MTGIMTAIFIILTNLGLPGLEESAVNPANAAPCSRTTDATDGVDQVWDAGQDASWDKISNGF